MTSSVIGMISSFHQPQIQYYFCLICWTCILIKELHKMMTFSASSNSSFLKFIPLPWSQCDRKLSQLWQWRQNLLPKPDERASLFWNIADGLDSRQRNEKTIYLFNKHSLRLHCKWILLRAIGKGAWVSCCPIHQREQSSMVWKLWGSLYCSPKGFLSLRGAVVEFSWTQKSCLEG